MYYFSDDFLKTKENRLDFLATFALFYAYKNEEKYKEIMKEICNEYNLNFDEEFKKVKSNLIAKKYIGKRLYDIFSSKENYKNFIDDGKW